MSFPNYFAKVTLIQILSPNRGHHLHYPMRVIARALYKAESYVHSRLSAGFLDCVTSAIF